MRSVTLIGPAPNAASRLVRALRELGLDVRLRPEIDGPPPSSGPVVVQASAETVARMRALWPGVPLLAVVADPEHGRRACAAGADEFALASADASEIAVRLDLLERRRMRDEVLLDLAERPQTRDRPLILVVEDDTASLDAVSELLATHYDVAGAAEAEAGLKLARETLPDLVLMDLYLPGLDGLAALERLRADPDTAEIPVLLLSAAGDVPTKVRSLALGAVDYLTKPFSGPELVARVERTLRITAQREHYRALAQTDALTGLPNYRSFRARLADEVQRARRYDNDLTAVMVDLDNLKQINDRLGHTAGNRAIAATAEVLRTELRGSDFAARYGGDEFVVLLPHTSGDDARRFAERARAALASLRLEGGLDARASFGLASVRGASANDPDALLRAADAALYEAKRQGRNRIVVADSTPPCS